MAATVLTVAMYHRMIEAGVLRSGDKVDLLNGQLIAKLTPHPPNASAVALVDYAVRNLIREGEWTARVRQPITLPDWHEPEPDLVLARGTISRYFGRHPGPADIGLVVEVADSSLRLDREERGPVYAAHKLPIYWVVNLIDDVVEVYTRPRGGRNPRYLTRTDFGRGADVPVILDGLGVATLAVDGLLPPGGDS